jgi:hypothetical protein
MQRRAANINMLLGGHHIHQGKQRRADIFIHPFTPEAAVITASLAQEIPRVMAKRANCDSPTGWLNPMVYVLSQDLPCAAQVTVLTVKPSTSAPADSNDV